MTTTTTTKTCATCLRALRHADFSRNRAHADGLARWCRTCIADRRLQRATTRQTLAARAAATPVPPRLAAAIQRDQARKERQRAGMAQPDRAPVVRRANRYIPPKGLLDLWAAIQAGAADGSYPEAMLFVGPSGCGKTEGAKYLADMAGLDYTKVDAAAMTDPESWFGTREVVAQDGVSVTTYRPSDFVQAIQKPGLVLIDEANRIRPADCNIILPLTDATGTVTNPLTGEVVKRHPGCYIVLSGNRGLRFVGTYAIEPALLTRVLTVPFDYLPPSDEAALVAERTGAPMPVCTTLVRFANEIRQRSKANDEIAPISTREVLRAAKLIAAGADPDTAVAAAIVDQVSDDGGADSPQMVLHAVWVGLRPLIDRK